MQKIARSYWDGDKRECTYGTFSRDSILMDIEALSFDLPAVEFGTTFCRGWWAWRPALRIPSELDRPRLRAPIGIAPATAIASTVDID